MLSKRQLQDMIKKSPPLIEGMINPAQQIQVNGVDLTLAQVERFTGPGQVDFDNSERKLPTTENVSLKDGWFTLNQGVYKIKFNEVVHLPTNFMAIGRPRSTLLRCGASVATAAWDGGYEGRSESLLVVHNPLGIKLKQNAKVMQLIFLPMQEATDAYSGTYQGENIKKG